MQTSDDPQLLTAKCSKRSGRRDTAGERIVSASHDVQRYCGTAYAASYLEANNISLQVALRVLTQPQLRRRLIPA